MGFTDATSDLLNRYLDDVGRHRLLTADEEVALAQAIEEGRRAAAELDSGADPARQSELAEKVEAGERARDTFIAANLRLVVAYARKYARSPLEMTDLIQEGNLGLMRAVDGFDWRKGFKFSTYASWWITQAISRGIAAKGRAIRVPVAVAESVTKVDAAVSKLTNRLGRSPTDEEVAEETHLPIGDVFRVRRIAKVLSLNAPAAEDGESELGDLVADDEVDPFERVVDRVAASGVRSAVATLDDKDRLVLTLRYGLDGQEPRTLGDVAGELGVTRERVRQIEARAIRRLRQAAAGVGLENTSA